MGNHFDDDTHLLVSSQQFSALNIDLIDKHPVLRNRAHLPTPPIKRVYALVERAIVQRDPGCSFVAYSRFGKTFAISLLSDQLGNNFPTVPILIINAKGHPRFSEGMFYSELLEGCTRTQAGPGKPTQLRSRLIRFLWTLAESRESDRIVLFVDEAQNWQEPELSALRDLSNDLALFGDVMLIVNFFGAPMLSALRTTLLQINRTDLVGRFMVRQYEFPGIASESDLEETMKCYDDVAVSEFPEKSGVSFSAFFLPLGFQSGWRLGHEAGLAWEQFKNAAQPHGGVKQIGMQWVASSIRSFFVAQREADHAEFHGVLDDWADAIDKSGFAQTIGVTYSVNMNLAASQPSSADTTNTD